MRKPVIALCLAAVSLIYVGGSANAADMVYKAPPAPVAEPPPPGPARYYSDYGLFFGGWGYGSLGGYGPFADCNGSRCYIGPPASADVGYTKVRRHYGQYYYGISGGYYRDGWYH
jgi:hypothetical protein